MMRRIVAAVFLFTLAFTISASAGQVKDMKKTSPTVLNNKAPANAVDINSASENDLVAIGLDRAVAKKVVDARPFRSKHDLVTKQLLTQDQYDKLRDKIVARRSTKKGKGGQ